jgi:hypothetical protein
MLSLHLPSRMYPKNLLGYIRGTFQKKSVLT